MVRVASWMVVGANFVHEYETLLSNLSSYREHPLATISEPCVDGLCPPFAGVA
jgi:hypothetical protein